LKISKCTNKARYNNSDINVSVTQEEIDYIFKIKAPFDNINNKSHTKLAQEFTRKKGSRGGFKVFVYKNGTFLCMFKSYNLAQKELGFKGNRTIARIIDTNISKNGYTFYSGNFIKY
jgi:hypothetical protein